MITVKDVIDILGGEIVDKIVEEPLSPTGRLLRKFLIVRGKEVEENYRRGRELRGDDLRIEPGDCANCPAYAKWPGHNETYYCFRNAYLLGRSGRPEIPSKENCRSKSQQK